MTHDINDSRYNGTQSTQSVMSSGVPWHPLGKKIAISFRRKKILRDEVFTFLVNGVEKYKSNIFIFFSEKLLLSFQEPSNSTSANEKSSKETFNKKCTRGLLGCYCGFSLSFFASF